MNTPIRKHVDEKENKTYSGGYDGSPVRSQRRAHLQKANNNPLYGFKGFLQTTLGFGENNKPKIFSYIPYFQKVFNKKQNKIITILHSKKL